MILFPAIPFDISHVDPNFDAELEAASLMSLDCALIDYESLLDGDPSRAVRRIPRAGGDSHGSAVLRGWMLSVEQYGSLYDALLVEKNLALANTPEQYAVCHELPGWYYHLLEFTPETLIAPGVPPAIDAFTEAVQKRFDRGGLIIKDYVKSRKHEWLDACFVPDVADGANLRRVAANFAERQGSDLIGGLVARRYADLQIAGYDSRTGMPIPNEWRIFRFRTGATLFVPYWCGELAEASDAPGLEFDFAWQPLLAKVDALGSNFCAIDVAAATSGDLILIEIGDGQVSDVRDTNAIHALVGMLSESYLPNDFDAQNQR